MSTIWRRHLAMSPHASMHLPTQLTKADPAAGEPLAPPPTLRSSAFVVAAAAGAIALGYALQVSFGTYHPIALGWLTVTLLCCVAAILFANASLPRGRTAVMMLIGLGLVLQLAQLFARPPGVYLAPRSEAHLTPFLIGVTLLAVLVAAGLSTKSWAGRAHVPLMLAAFCFCGVWIIGASPNVFIDTYTVHQDSAAALRAGVNPYTITFPDIYQGESPFFRPGVSVGGRLQFGYPYLPATLLLAMPGHLLTGEHRFSQLACITAAAGLMACARPNALGPLAAGMFLLTPRGFQVVEDAWTEPFLACLLAAVVFTALRARRALPYVLGVFLASKQYAIFFAPLALLLIPRPWNIGTIWPIAWRAAIAALAVNLPFVLWDVDAFLHSTVMYQLTAPFRPDSLSYLAMWARQTGMIPPTALAFVAMVIATALVLWRAPRTPAGFALGVGFSCAAFFAFGKQAFLNNYYLVVAALWCAVAVADSGYEREPRDAEAVTSPGLQPS